MERFPLIPIRDDAHVDEALDVINGLLEQERDSGAQDYLGVLTDLVAAYEDKHVAMAKVSESDVLRELMRSNGLTQIELAKKTRIFQSTISAVLSGARSLTKEHVIKLAGDFGISPAAFIPGS